MKLYPYQEALIRRILDNTDGPVVLAKPRNPYGVGLPLSIIQLIDALRMLQNAQKGGKAAFSPAFRGNSRMDPDSTWNEQ